MTNSLIKMFKRYKERLNFNKELLFSEIGAFIIGPLSAQIASLFTASRAIIAFGASSGDYLGYTSAYAISSFFDNRKLYWDNKKRKIRKLFYKHIAKFIIGAAFVDVVYYSARTYVTYFILGFGLAPYKAAFFSQLSTMLLYFGLMNIMGSVMGIIKKKATS